MRISEALEPCLRAHELLSSRPDKVTILRNDSYVGSRREKFVDQYASAVLVVLILDVPYFDHRGTMAEWKRVVDLRETRVGRVLPVYLYEGHLEISLSEQYSWFLEGVRAWQGATPEAIATKIYDVWRATVESWTEIFDYTILHFENSESAGQEVKRLIEEQAMSAYDPVHFNSSASKPRPQESYCCIAPVRLPAATRLACERFLAASGVYSSLEPLWIVAGDTKEDTPPHWSAVSADALAERLHATASLERVNIICGKDVRVSLMSQFRPVWANVRIWPLRHLHGGTEEPSAAYYRFSSLFARAKTAKHNFVVLSPDLASDAAALSREIGKANVDALFTWLLDEEWDQPWKIIQSGSPVSRADRLILSPLPLACEDAVSMYEWLRQLAEGHL